MIFAVTGQLFIFYSNKTQKIKARLIKTIQKFYLQKGDLLKEQILHCSPTHLITLSITLKGCGP